MALSKKQSMIHTYREFMEMCFRNDYSGILPRFVDEKIAGFGTALDEKIQGIAGIKKLLKIQKRQSKGLEISWKIKPVSHYTSEGRNTAVFADDVYLTIKTGHEIMKMYVRISVILNYHNNLWKVIHWHCSKPEQVESEKDTWGVVSWKQRAQELERLVAEKTADLIKKNRELAIEAAMEKVRARSLAMQKPEELVEVAAVLRNEMGKLGVEELETSSIYIVDEKKATTACWYAIKDVRGQNKRLVTDYMTLVLEETWVGREMQKFYRSKQTRTSILMRGKNRKEWINHCADKSSVLQGYYGGEIPDRTYHLLKFSNGFMGAASPGEISPESWDLLQRATAVFSFAYKRFSDLQKAEAQAREAQIQLALERVRARTMAMQKSEELPEAAALLFQQVQSLGMPAWSAGYCLWNDDDKKSVTLWMSSEGVIQPPFTAPTTKDALFIQMRKGAEEGKTLYVVEMGGKQLVKHYQYMRTLPVVGEILDSIIAAGHPLPTFQIMHQAYFSKGFLLFITYQPVPDVHEIFKRFAKVFDQTYIRFLDLQKAEAQAREAQIEAALERVRSRSLAMHNSNELSELVATLFDELIKLDLVLARCIIWILNQDKSAQLWMANSESKQLANNYHITRIDHSYYNAIVKGWQDRNEHWVYELKGAEKKSIDQILLFETELRQLPEEVKQGILNTTQTYVAGAFNKFGLIEASGPVRHTEEQLQILHRFNKVFEQCYTRFLDLQKAEAQAREAQIEAALERVRAKTMAMHRSEDLLSTVSLLFDQFRLLQKGNISEDIDRSALALVNEKEKRFDLWITQEGGTESNQKYQIDFSEETHGIALCQSFKQKDSHIVIDNTGEKLSQWLDYLKSTGMKISPGLYKKRRINTSIRFSNGFIIITSEEPLTDQNILLLNRFTKVFEQTYTRFLDLQKAEAQAREAQIEAALERVRSRSMAMHKSEELPEVIQLVFEQLRHLNFNIDSAQFDLNFRESDDINLWTAVPGQPYPTQQHIPYFNNAVFNSVKHAKEAGLSLSVHNFTFEEKNEFFNYFFKHTNIPEERRKFILSLPGWARSVVYLDRIYLGIQNYSGIPYSDTEHVILGRFAKVFEQAYTRFLDLQKAEAQAREAQIEAALERVRAQAMAMHNSEDMGQCIVKMFSELTGLGVDERTRFGIGILNHDNEDIQLWTARKDGGEVKMHIGHLNTSWHPLTISARKAWKEKAALHEYILEGEDLLNYYQMINHAPDYKLQVAIEKLPEREIHYGFIFNHGFFYAFTPREFQPELIQITQRFSALFEQTYRRYLDLERAEAQAREAQIEAALERVRSRSMAMHKSDELLEAGEILFSEMQKLGIESLTAGFVLMDKEEENGLNYTPDPSTKKIMSLPVIIPHNETIHMQRVVENWKKGITHYVVEMDEKETIQHQTFIAERSTNFTLNAEQLIAISPARLFLHNFYFKEGYLLIVGGSRLSAEQNDIMVRFAKVFQQTYTRFLDLQKAEAQAREAEIELALERVRARTMAMQHSGELQDTSLVLFQQLKELGEPAEQCTIGIIKESEGVVEISATLHGTKMKQTFRHKLDEPFGMSKIFKGWKDQQKTLIVEIREDELRRYNQYRNELIGKETFPVNVLTGECWIMHIAYFSKGMLALSTNKPRPAESLQLLERFAIVFEQTYTRFNDLQKAEAQAREAQIQLALERVRAKAMAMQHSGELREIAAAVHDQLLGLGFTSGFCSIVIMDRITGDMTWWMFFSGKEYPESYHMPFCEHPFYLAQLNRWKQGEKYSVIEVSGEEKKSYDKYTFDQTEFKNIPIESQQFMMSFEKIIFSNAYMKHGAFSWGVEPIDDEHAEVLQRFANVFEQCYTRFLDLQKAEVQAREAQIEAALEKVRSRSLAMHTSSELNEVVKVLFEKLTELQVPSTAVGIQTFMEGSNDMQAFVCGDVGTGIVINQYRLPYFDHPIVHDYLHAHKNKLDVFVGHYSKKVKDSFYDVIVKLPELKDLAAEVKTMIYNSDFYEVTIVPAEKSLIAVNDFQGNPLAESQVNILKRFAKVFDQTYTRFLDLQKAEAQAREANIEAALERVRAQAMAMHHTEDLSKTIQVYFEQLDDLIDSAIVRCGAGLLNKDNTIAEMSTASKSLEGETYGVKGRIDMRGHPLLESTYEHWLEQKEYHHVLRGNEIREYYQYITGQVAIPENRGEDELHFYFPMFTEGSFYVVTSTEVPENELQIFRRFSSVLSLTYRRFNDLQKAEAQAKEAVKQSSLDRIRGEIASMRTPQDLDRITPLIWKELTALNIPFIRCGVFIMDHALQQIHTFLSTPDGKAIAAFHLPYDSQGRTREILTSWNNKQAYIEHWDETAFSELGDLLVQQGALPSKDIYLKTVPGGGLYLHCLPFMQGMLYVGNTVKLNEVEIQLIQSVADAFSTAYARYEDFNKLEAAKATVEKTLTDLKQTQAQLVQSEKMASLGELTAGIAHEIQNPLNFVNNFSEVSHELLDEMKAEIDKGNYEEVKAISRDVKQNLEKILHHGKRADGIVKGMLQHSRSSSGTKEPTDINALADEYLRLAYHGLRAKDKSFNAKFETHFDESIEKVEMVPQDIGRVILNLITNAFYAVNERLRQAQPASGYEPTVTVSTKKEGNKVLIRVKDNGNGIPDSIKEKIFQPFFTTKPTGQGTGLGLSLSYDVVKAHGGELNVETKENEGSAFIILLPVV